MTTFFTKRQRALAGLPAEDEPSTSVPSLPPRCCDQATSDRCGCEVVRWKCPAHGATGPDCNPRFTHD
ncbi:hypothetical protein [Archangium primigenium]|uniref:hypothetical protein n=1 Tax=[Archangium] primigenium TaxID=2792470 RepID=UPI00195A7FED|nr:hypothetical protein [Archangium primigenium]MBM7117616.1 hypothetical protein [Archangium primigenium]